jgi:hypothetical protein
MILDPSPPPRWEPSFAQTHGVLNKRKRAPQVLRIRRLASLERWIRAFVPGPLDKASLPAVQRGDGPLRRGGLRRDGRAVPRSVVGWFCLSRVMGVAVTGCDRPNFVGHVSIASVKRYRAM